ncbi:MAG: beta-propeller domain-containing protein [Sedimentibacter sp.]
MKMKMMFEKTFIISVIMMFCFSLSVFGETKGVTVYVDNEKVDFDVKPFIENGRTMVPLRGVFEKLGADIEWNKSILEVVIKDKNNEIEMLLGNNKVLVNGEVRDIDVPTKMVSSRTFAPVRFISENLGHDIRWDGNTNSVYITKNDSVLNSRNIISTVGTKENLIALLEYNSKLYNYIWSDRGMLETDSAVSESKGSDAVSEAPQAEASPEDSSDTNNQVEGVQEGDVIKNDGKYIFINTDSGLKIIDSNPTDPSVVAVVNVPENTSISEIFVEANKLVVIGQNNFYYMMNEYDEPVENGESVKIGYIMPPRYYEDRTNVLIYNIENAEKPVLEREFLFDGNYLSGRTIGDNLYLISSKYMNFSYDMFKKDDMPLPYYTDVLGDEKYEFGYDEIKYFPNYIDSRYMYTIGINLFDNTTKPDVNVYLGGSDTIYVSADNMYTVVANYSYNNSIAQTELYSPQYSSSTVVYKYMLENGKINFVSQGEVPGTIINQFSMDEYKNMFRIATTTGEIWSNTSKNNLYVLDEKLETVGKLEGLAPGEKIYSTRFAGDRTYMVTFKQIDPLYVIDTSNPLKPQVKGLLKIPGYSTYLHLVDENHIIGFGYDTEQNQWGGTVTGGFKLSMFDVTDINKPKETYTEIIGDQGTYSELLYNHKALMFSLNKGLMAFPINVTGEKYETNFNGAYIYNLMNDCLGFKTKISHMEGDSYDYRNQMKRIIYIGDYLYTFSENKMQVHSIITNKLVNELIIKQ